MKHCLKQAFYNAFHSHSQVYIYFHFSGNFRDLGGHLGGLKAPLLLTASMLTHVQC